MKKSLNVHFSANIIDNSIIKFLSKNFELNIINISEKELKNTNIELLEKIKSLDLIIFIGGEDVNPEFYGQEVGKYTQINKKRDNLEFELLYPKKISQLSIKRIPKLGICRGAQLLTVYSGGTLIQHVEGHKNNEQIIDISIGSQKQIIKQISVSSDHHQMMFPYSLNENNYELIGWSTHFQSNTYLNGRNEEIKLPKDFLEPEIVYYKNTNSLCIQSHPEWCINSEGSDYCLSLIEKYLFKNNNKKEIVEEFQLPDGMDSFPIGWNVTNSFGEQLKFDGENFVSLDEYYESRYGQKKTQSFYKPLEQIKNDDYSVDKFSFQNDLEIKIVNTNETIPVLKL